MQLGGSRPPTSKWQRRSSLGVCLYCGRGGRFVSACPTPRWLVHRDVDWLKCCVSPPLPPFCNSSNPCRFFSGSDPVGHSNSSGGLSSAPFFSKLRALSLPPQGAFLKTGRSPGSPSHATHPPVAVLVAVKGLARLCLRLGLLCPRDKTTRHLLDCYNPWRSHDVPGCILRWTLSLACLLRRDIWWSWLLWTVSPRPLIVCPCRSSPLQLKKGSYSCVIFSAFTGHSEFILWLPPTIQWPDRESLPDTGEHSAVCGGLAPEVLELFPLLGWVVDRGRIIYGVEAYTVHRILDVQKQGRGGEYFVDWEGYGLEERSWMYRHCILDKNLLRDFYQVHPERPERTPGGAHGAGGGG